MALSHWLPLNGTLNDAGQSPSTALVIGATGYSEGKVGQGFAFNGASRIVLSPITLKSTAAIAWWANTTDTSGMFWVLSAATSPNMNFWLAQGKYYLNTGDSYNNPFQNNGVDVANFHDGKWHHYIVNFTGTKVDLYIDGEYYASAKTTKSPAITAKNIRIGGGFNNTNNTNYDLTGTISDFRIYDTQLSRDEIDEVYRMRAFEFDPKWRHNGNGNVLGDASGIKVLTSQIGHNLTVSGSSMYFNGSTSYSEFDGLKLSGGTVSMWVNIASMPTAQKVLYFDSTSKMVIGFLAGGTILTNATSANKPSYQSTGMTWGAFNNIISVWNSAGTPTAFYVNGVQPATGGSSKWTNSGQIAAIGRRIGSGTADYFNGYINDVTVYQKQLTAEEALEIYAKGPNKLSMLPDGYEQLEYIETNGTQYIDTGKQGEMTGVYIIDFKQTAASNMRLWGCFNQSSYVGPNMSLTYGDGLIVRWESASNQQRSVRLGNLDTNRHTVIIRNGDVYYDNVSKGKSLGHSDGLAFNYNIFLGTINPGGTSVSTNSKARFYRYQVLHGSVLVQNLVPCKRLSDNAIGMYDIASGQFLANSGTGSFIAGPVVQ